MATTALLFGTILSTDDRKRTVGQRKLRQLGRCGVCERSMSKTYGRACQDEQQWAEDNTLTAGACRRTSSKSKLYVGFQRGSRSLAETTELRERRRRNERGRDSEQHDRQSKDRAKLPRAGPVSQQRQTQTGRGDRQQRAKPESEHHGRTAERGAGQRGVEQRRIHHGARKQSPQTTRGEEAHLGRQAKHLCAHGKAVACDGGGAIQAAGNGAKPIVDKPTQPSETAAAQRSTT